MKRLLLIAPKFHGYDKYIRNELLRKYAIVHLKNELPFNSSTFYFLLEKISPKVRTFLWRCYDKNIRKIISNKSIDSVFIIRGELIPEYTIQFIKNEGISITYYQWDSIKNNPNSLMISRYADCCYTFDRLDHENYPVFKYLPLFYYWGGLDRNTSPQKHYGCMFFGSWNYDRLKIVEQIQEMCNTLGISLFAQLYMPFQSYINRVFKGVKFPYHLLRFSSMPRSEYYSLLKSSDIIFDVPSKTQVGSTMRTIETLSLQKKLITTNVNVKREDFYHPDNILIWPASIEEIKQFLEVPFNTTVLSRINSLPGWIDSIGL